MQFSPFIHAAPILIIGLFVIGIYGFVLAWDAICRPSSEYKLGSKFFWVTFFLFVNPIFIKYLGHLVWQIGTSFYVIGIFLYYNENKKLLKS